jgi:aspartyl protease family protein
MDRFQLSYIVAVVVLCIVVARGLDRLIVDPVQSPQALRSPKIASTRAPPAPVPEITTPIHPSASQEQRIPTARDGHYYADASINGWPVQHMLIDTGATYVALSYEDAASLGIYPGSGDFKYETRTANGTAHVAAVTLQEVRLGALIVENVPAVVAERGALDVSLLGMSFLSRLSRVETLDGALVLRQ